MFEDEDKKEVGAAYQDVEDGSGGADGDRPVEEYDGPG